MMKQIVLSNKKRICLQYEEPKGKIYLYVHNCNGFIHIDIGSIEMRVFNQGRLGLGGKKSPHHPHKAVLVEVHYISP